MRNPSAFPQIRVRSVLRPIPKMAIVLGLMVGAIGSLCPSPARADSPETAPPEIIRLLSDIDAAANRQNIKDVMAFYSSDFTHSDGWTRKSMTQALKDVWKRYSQLNYRTELVSWEAQGNDIVAETTTQITGTENWENRELALNATLRSRQHYRNGKIVHQEILTEESQLTSGNNPPTLEVYLPEQVAPEGRYHFDVIVREPLEKDFLIGTALEEPANLDTYLHPSQLELEGLSAGGIFKVGQASAETGDSWVSAVIIREGGISAISRRLRVEE
jgi:ketosteroid isomerase-like protein